MLSLCALALALTRSAFVAAAIALVWLFVAWKPARRLAGVLIVVMCLLIVSGYNPAQRVLNTHVLVDRIASISSPESHTAHLRFQVWSRTPRMIEDYPIFGVGADNYVKHASDYGLISPGVPSHAHNIPLVFATELGIPGLIVLVWIMLALYRTLVGAMRVRGEPEHSLALALTGVFLALLVDGITDYGYGDNAFFLTVLMLMALACRIERDARAVAPVAQPAPAAVRPAFA